jgi:hypothetical protein
MRLGWRNRVGAELPFVLVLTASLLIIGACANESGPRLSVEDYSARVSTILEGHYAGVDDLLVLALPLRAPRTFAEEREQLRVWRGLLEATSRTNDGISSLRPPRTLQHDHEWFVESIRDVRDEISRYLLPALIRGDLDSARESATRIENTLAKPPPELSPQFLEIAGPFLGS